MTPAPGEERLSYGEILRLTEGHGTADVYERIQTLLARLADVELVLDRIANDHGTESAWDDAMYYQQLAAGALKENT